MSKYQKPFSSSSIVLEIMGLCCFLFCLMSFDPELSDNDVVVVAMFVGTGCYVLSGMSNTGHYQSVSDFIPIFTAVLGAGILILGILLHILDPLLSITLGICMLGAGVFYFAVRLLTAETSPMRRTETKRPKRHHQDTT